jgi:uncharacterized protein YdaU (DUF1376 family)
MYVRGGPVPDEPRYIAGVCNCSVRKWNAIRERLIALGKIQSVDGYLTNHRAEEEIEIAGKISREAAENGSKGGDKSAEIRAQVKKNNALGQARLKLSTTTAIKKEGSATRSDPTESVLLDRFADEELFKASETIRGSPTPTYMQRDYFNASVVKRAKAELEQARAAA